MLPRHALAICELSALAPRQEVTHSAAKVVVPKTMPLSIQTAALACAWEARFSGVLKRSKAFCLATSTALGLENCLIVKSLARCLASCVENWLSAAIRSLAFTSGRLIISWWRMACCCLYSALENLAFAFWLRFSLHSEVQRRLWCFCFVSSEAAYPDAPSPPSVRLQRPSSLYLRMSSRSSSKAHHSCIPDWTISIV